MKKAAMLLFAVLVVLVVSPLQANYLIDRAMVCCWTSGGIWWEPGTGFVSTSNYCNVPSGTCDRGYRTCYSDYTGTVDCVDTSIGSFVLEDFVQKAVGGNCSEDEPNVSASIEVSGFQYAQCINGGGNVAPGRERVALTTTADFQSDYCAHGKFHFSTSVEDNQEFSIDQVPVSSSPKELGCPNGNWDLVRVDGKVQAATDEAGNAFTDWNAMNIRVTKGDGETVESRACCVTSLPDAKPNTCEHAYCNEKGVPDATAEGYRAGDLFCGVVWSSDRKCDEDTGACPVGSVCGARNTCEAIACVDDGTCPDGSECANGGCVPSCS